MGKTVVYILVLGLLGLGVWYFLFKDDGVFEEAEAGFTIRDTASVHKIFLANPQGDTISLTRDEHGWLVNGGYRASRTMIQTLLQTFTQQFAAYPVQEAAHNNVIKAMAGTAIKTEVFTQGGRLMRTFYVGGQVTGNKGTYMLVEGAERPYVVQMPLYTGYLTPRYSTSLKEWRDRTVVELEPAQLDKVEVKYVSEHEYLNSFTLVRKNETEFTIQLHPELKMPGEPNAARVKAYAAYFKGLGCEGYLNGTTGLDSIIASVPKQCEIHVTGKDGYSRRIDIYHMFIGKRSKNQSLDSTVVPDVYDADRLYGIINQGRDTVILQSNTFDKIMRKGYEFYGDDVQE